MEKLRRDGLDLYFKILGQGPDVFLLHPFPSCHELWLPVAIRLSSRYRVILPDLRAHGHSGVPDRPALMSDYVADLDAICREIEVTKAIFAGISIGGYMLFELWRRLSHRARGLIFLSTKEVDDSSEVRANRLRSAEEVLVRGAHWFIESQLPTMLGVSTRRNRPDVVAAAQYTMRFATPQGIAMAQRGMAERPDSTPTLPLINVPVQFVGGEEDTLTPPSAIQRMHAAVSGSQVAILPKAGHFVALEAPDDCFRVLRRFCDQHAQ